MYLPLLQPSHKTEYFVSGEVEIDECAVIGPGVILQADAGCRIKIAAGVCIGMGAVIHAHQGDLIMESGATIGAGVLMVGTGKVGSNVCVGACTTLINQDLESAQVIPAGSVLGDHSRSVDLSSEPSEESSPSPEPVEAPSPASNDGSTPAPEATPAPASPSTSPSATIVFSQHHLHRLMGTLFPHRQILNQNFPNGPPPNADDL
jgi:carbon dioxide concentrating mechanism protein CcmN